MDNVYERERAHAVGQQFNDVLVSTLESFLALLFGTRARSPDARASTAEETAATCSALPKRICAEQSHPRKPSRSTSSTELGMTHAPTAPSLPTTRTPPEGSPTPDTLCTSPVVISPMPASPTKTIDMAEMIYEGGRPDETGSSTLTPEGQQALADALRV